MRVRKLDTSGDLVTSGVVWAYDNEAIAQTIKTRLKLFLGEYFRDVSDGMPWFEKTNGLPGILQKGYTIAQAESLIRERIVQTNGVLKILKFSTTYNVDTRAYKISATVYTKYGTVEVDYGTAD